MHTDKVTWESKYLFHTKISSTLSPHRGFFGALRSICFVGGYFRFLRLLLVNLDFYVKIIEKGEQEGGEVGDGEGVGNTVIVEDPKRVISVILRLGSNSFEFYIVC